MSYEEFIQLVRELRTAQKNWFRLRDRRWLEEAKRLERQVDDVIKRGPAHRELF